MLRELLSSDEIARAERFIFDRDRNHFIGCRAALRRLLAERLGMAPGEIDFSYGSNGKPFVPHAAIEFNVSHSGEFALIGLSERIAIGVDIEKIREPTRNDWSDLAKRFFSEGEVKALSTLSPEDQTEGFFACWSRKEAYIKRHGLGLALPLGDFSVSVDPAHAELLGADWCPRDLRQTTLYDLHAPVGYRASIALEQTAKVQIHQRSFQI